MMVTQQCVQCRHIYEFYQVYKIMKDCPKCGASGGYAPRIEWPTPDERKRVKGEN